MTAPGSAGPAELRPAARLARRFEAIAAVISRIGAGVAAIVCLITLAAVCYAVAMRYFFGHPQGWTDEAIGWLIVIAVMLAVPEAQRRGENIGVDAVTGRLTGWKQRALGLFGIATVVICAWLMLDEGLEMVEFTRMIGIKSIAISEVELWVVQAAVPLCGAMLLLVALAQFICLALGLWPRDYEMGAGGSYE